MTLTAKNPSIHLCLALLSGLLLASCGDAGTAEQSASQQTAPEALPARSVEMTNLMANPKVSAAVQSIRAMDERNIERLIAMTEIPAPPFQEAARAEDLAERLGLLGLTDISMDEVGNVLARRPGSEGKKTIAVGAHIDTVFPPETDVTVRREGNVFFAPGVGDNTRGLVVLLSLVELIEKFELDTRSDLLFIGTVGEEGLGDLRGVRHLFRDGGPAIDKFIAIDGGSSNRLVVKAVGSIRYRVTFKGPGGHSYGAFGRGHPHQALAKAITGFTEAGGVITKGESKATFSVGRIGGGTSINSIPFTSWMEVDMRSADPGRLNQLDAALREAIDMALEEENKRRSKGDALTVEIESVGKRPAGETDQTSSLVRNASAALRHVGLEPNLKASSTDANIPMSLGVPAITMSRGGKTRNAHAPDESWENKDSHVAIEAVLLTLLAQAGLK